MDAAPYWVVWQEDGPPPRVKHADAMRANDEAERLARQNPGKSFVVLVPVARFTRTDVKIERFSVDDDTHLPF